VHIAAGRAAWLSQRTPTRTVLAGIVRDSPAGIWPPQAALVAATYAEQHDCFKHTFNSYKKALTAAERQTTGSATTQSVDQPNKGPKRTQLPSPETVLSVGNMACPCQLQRKHWVCACPAWHSVLHPGAGCNRSWICLSCAALVLFLVLLAYGCAGSWCWRLSLLHHFSASAWARVPTTSSTHKTLRTSGAAGHSSRAAGGISSSTTSIW
jgi:hypothetical protein